MQLRSRFLPAACAAAALAAAGCGGDPQAAGPGADDRADGPLVAAMMPNIPPYLYLDPDTGEVKGIDVDIVRAAAGAEQSDDRTQLLLRWRGPAA